MKRLIIASVIGLSLFACDQKQEARSTVEKIAKTEIIVRGEAQGTSYTIKYIAEEYNGIKEEVDSLLNAIDLSMSTYIPNSTISHLNKGDTVEIDWMFQEVLTLSKELNLETEGTFDPTIGPLIKAWGFDYANPQKMDSAKVDSLLKLCGFNQFAQYDSLLWNLNEKSRINFNAVAQGYSVDLMAQLLDKKRIENYYVELGGELIVKGKNKFSDWWVIGIDRPDGENLERNLSQRISIKNKALATSGNYRKFYEVDGKRYSHTLNPKTGYPAENSLLSATVIADNCGLADAMATAFMVMGTDKAKAYLEKHRELDAYLIYLDSENSYKNYFTKGIEEKLLKD